MENDLQLRGSYSTLRIPYENTHMNICMYLYIFTYTRTVRMPWEGLPIDSFTCDVTRSRESLSKLNSLQQSTVTAPLVSFCVCMCEKSTRDMCVFLFVRENVRARDEHIRHLLCVCVYV